MRRKIADRNKPGRQEPAPHRSCARARRARHHRAQIGIAQHRLGVAMCVEAAVLQQHSVVGMCHHCVQVMQHDEDGFASLSQLATERVAIKGMANIERGGGFIKHSTGAAVARARAIRTRARSPPLSVDKRRDCRCAASHCSSACWHACRSAADNLQAPGRRA